MSVDDLASHSTCTPRRHPLLCNAHIMLQRNSRKHVHVSIAPPRTVETGRVPAEAVRIHPGLEPGPAFALRDDPPLSGCHR